MVTASHCCILFDGAEGDIVIQGTLENSPTVSTFWVDIDIYSNKPDTLKYVNQWCVQQLKNQTHRTIQVDNVFKIKLPKF